MKAHVEHSWWKRAWDITLYDRGVVYRLADGDLKSEPRVDSEQVEPTLSLPLEALEAIVQALPGKVTANDATLDALLDARAVRDRLLTMVEKAAE